MKQLTKPYTLISFASSWGSKFGGINAFNTEFLEGIAIAYYNDVDVICIVAQADPADIEQANIEQAKNLNITLVTLPYAASDKHMDSSHAEIAIKQLKDKGFTFENKSIVYLGHDLISGQAALSAKEFAQGSSAIIHHMSYDQYEAYAENSQIAVEKRARQKELFSKADHPMAVGPLLRDALIDLIDDDNVTTLIPGFPDITPKRITPRTFSMFISGRLTPDAAKIKQGQLAIASFAHCYKTALTAGEPKLLTRNPKLLIRGVNFELENKDSIDISTSEQNLRLFAEEYAGAVMNIQALPYTTDRNALFDDLKNAGVCAMPSWHEGFGLVAWEAIAAGVPLIVTKDSGVYQLIEEKHAADENLFHAIRVRGSNSATHFAQDDLQPLTEAINYIASDLDKAREKARKLKSTLSDYTWERCATSATKTFKWDITPGIVKEALSTTITNTTSKNQPTSKAALPITPTVNTNNIAGYTVSQPTWQLNEGKSIAALLKANEQIIPFDDNRQTELDNLITWATATAHPISTRIVTGEGGTGKTRLALRLCQHLSTESLTTWSVGFLAKNSLYQLNTIWKSVSQLNKPALFVLDYAESQTHEFLAILTLAMQSHTIPKVCFLLLARNDGEWWDNLIQENENTEDLLHGPATTGPYQLPAMYDTADQKQQAYQTALHAFAHKLQVTAPRIKPVLTGEYFNNPLYIQMSALLALHGESSKNADGLTNNILNHEERYWQNLIQPQQVNISNKAARYLFTLATLTGNINTPKEAYAYYKQLEADTCSYTDFIKVFDCLSQLYPNQQGIQAIKPDLLGEALLIKTLSTNTRVANKILNSIFSDTSTGVTKQYALTLLTRLSAYTPAINSLLEQTLTQHLPRLIESILEVALATKGNLIPLTIKAFNQQPSTTKNSIAVQFSEKLTHNSLILNQLTYTVDGFIYNNATKKFDKKPPNKQNEKTQYKYIKTSMHYAIAAYHVGQTQKGCMSLSKALPIIKQLKDKKPTQYSSTYASLLSNYASFLSALGKDIEAEQYAKQALEIREALAQQNPDRYQADYATSLGNYANRLNDLGKDIGAEQYAKQALEIHEALAQQNPDRYQADYATSLSNYASFLSALGKDIEGEQYAKQALEIHEALAQQNPDRYQADYAASLNNYASFLSDLGDYRFNGQLSTHIDITFNLYKNRPKKYALLYVHALHTSAIKQALNHTPIMTPTIDWPSLFNNTPIHQHIIITALQLLINILRVNSSALTNDRTCALSIFMNNYQKEPISNQRQIEAVYLLSGLWLCHNKPEEHQEALRLWRQQHTAFYQRRNGNMPQYLLDIAQQWGVNWPEVAQ